VSDQAARADGSSEPNEPDNAPGKHPLATLIGGPRGALESILPPLAFVATFTWTSSIGWAVGVALILAALFAVWRIAEGKRPTRAVSALLIVALSAYVAVKMDFWPLVLANALSALAFALSIMIRWPLLGVIVGPIAGTRMRWRQDPDLLRAYSHASWLWVLLNVVRALAQVPLIQGEDLWALAAIRPVFYLLVILTILGSWAIIKRSLPAGHPGIRHPRIPADPPPVGQSTSAG